MKRNKVFCKAVKTIGRYLNTPSTKVYFGDVLEENLVIGAIPGHHVSRVFVRGKRNEPIITLTEENFINQTKFSILQRFIIVASIVDIEMANK